MNTELHLACTADGRYLPFCFTMLRSLFRNVGGRRLVVHFLAAPELERAHRDSVSALTRAFGHETVFHEIADEKVAGLPPMRSVQRLIWYRIFLPELLPEVERLLYLDSDLLVVDRIDALWDMDLRGRPLAAVPNVIEPRARAALLPALGLPPNASYFNSGVMLLDLGALRREHWPARIIEFAHRRASALVWGDQDALNGVLWDRYAPLHPRWNCMNSLYYFDYAQDVFTEAAIAEARRAPAILHFEGPDSVKPWNVRSTHPRRDDYLRELRAAQWALPLPFGTRLARSLWYAAPIALRRLVERLRGRTVVPAPAPIA